MKHLIGRETTILLAAAMMLCGCGAKSGVSAFTPANDIITYNAVNEQKTVITIGRYMVLDPGPLEAAMEQKFPDIDFVFTEPDAGDNDVAYMKMMADHGKLEDILLSTRTINDGGSFLYDLSGEEFTNHYNLSSLDSMNINGSLYQIPVTNTLCGIAYNKTLFEKNGWKVPETLEEFYSLLDTIRAAGIRPFAPCLKYYTIIESTGFGLSYDDVFAKPDSSIRYQNFYNKTGTSRGLLEPMFLTLKGLADKGYITDDDFHSSATDVRHQLYNEEIAMMPSNMDIMAFTESEKPADEIDLMGYPTRTKGWRVMQMVPGNKISVSAASMQDKKKAGAIREVMDYLSTAEGQDALFLCFSGISSLKDYQQKAVLSPDAAACLSAGRVFFGDYYASNDFVQVFENYVTGNMTMDEMISANDASMPSDYMQALSETPIGKAAADFSVLETSCYNADVMRAFTGADIALLPNAYFYKGNLARIFAGDIVLPNRFVLKGVSAKDYLTSYEITGAKLKELLEHPIINGKEVNAVYAVSGLKVEYAPWADKDSNVKKATLADGSDIADESIYKVAAWAGSIDDSYIKDTFQAYPEAGDNRALMTAAIRKAGTISPAEDGRIRLDWK